MKKLRRILVACEDLKGIHSALDKAAYLEHYSGCDIELMEVIWDEVYAEAIPDKVKESLKESLLAGERQELEEVIADAAGKVASLSGEVVWHKHPDQVILERVEQNDIDLLIVVPRRHNIADALLTPLDWKLIRHGNCPVLVCRNRTWQAPSTVLAAVDTGDPSQQSLNQEIVLSGRYFASLLDAGLHLVSVYPSMDFTFDPKRGPDEFDRLKADMREIRQSGMQALVGDESQCAKLHLREGKPAVEIPDLANEMGAAVTLIGTHAREGVKKWLLGNTSEAAMSRLEGDILVVRDA